MHLTQRSMGYHIHKIMSDLTLGKTEILFLFTQNPCFSHSNNPPFKMGLVDGFFFFLVAVLKAAATKQ